MLGNIDLIDNIKIAVDYTLKYIKTVLFLYDKHFYKQGRTLMPSIYFGTSNSMEFIFNCLVKCVINWKTTILPLVVNYF